MYRWSYVYKSSSLQCLESILQHGLKELIPDELVLLDVCMPPHPKTDTSSLQIEHSFIETLFTWLALFVMQINMAFAFLTQYYITPDIAVLQYFAGFTIARWMLLFPYHDVDDGNFATRLAAVNMHHLMYMMYPYYYYWKSKLCFWKNELQGCHLPIDLRKTPVLYMYGQDKNIMFHNPTMIALLEEEFMQCRRSKAVEVRNAGHWLHLQQEEVCFEEIKK